MLLLLACASPSEKLDAFLDERRVEAEAPGLAVGIVKGGELAWSGAYGSADLDADVPVTTDTVFMLASVSKTTIAVAAMQAVEAGLLDLDADVDDLLPFSVRHPDWPDTPITTRMLLTHTSSIRDRWDVWGDTYTLGDATEPLGDFLEGYLVPGGVDYAAENWTTWEAGTTEEYSNVGASLAAYVVEVAVGESFDAWCDEQLFAPLGMTHTGWHLADFDDDTVIAMPTAADGTAYGQYGYPDYPDGELRSTVGDLALWQANMQEEGGELLSAASYAEIKRVQDEAIDPGQGLLWYYDTRAGADVFGHNGGDDGVATEVFYRVDDGVGVIVLMNGDWRNWNPVGAMEQALWDYADAEL